MDNTLQEPLTITMEECGELIQACSKAIRCDDYHDNEKLIEEIGDVMGLTRERVRQIREKALQKLREPGKNRRLKEFCAN